jgi:DNA-directed RNA polymerase sigma subunit (sigma70/sigma32)
MDHDAGESRDWQWRPIRTLREVADLLGVDHKSVYKSERAALRKLRERLLAIPDVRELLEDVA